MTTQRADLRGLVEPVSDEDKRELMRAAALPNSPTDLTFHARKAMEGKGEFAYEWTDKPHRLVYRLCSVLEYLSAPGEPVAYFADWPGLTDDEVDQLVRWFRVDECADEYPQFLRNSGAVLTPLYAHPKSLVSGDEWREAIKSVREATLFADGVEGDLFCDGITTMAGAYMEGRQNALTEVEAAVSDAAGRIGGSDGLDT